MNRRLQVCIGEAKEPVGTLLQETSGNRESCSFAYHLEWLTSTKRFNGSIRDCLLKEVTTPVKNWCNLATKVGMSNGKGQVRAWETAAGSVCHLIFACPRMRFQRST